MRKLSCGLVLEGGGMRGLFTAGVLDFFLEKDLSFPLAVGVSAGAAFGCNLKSRQKGRALRYNTRYCADSRYCSFSSLLKTGDLFGAEFCYRTLPQELDPFDWETYEKDSTCFWAVCTRVETGKAEYFLCEGEHGRVLDVFRASASMPLVSRSVEIDGKEYLDGGVSDSIPLEFARSQGFLKNLVVLTQPRDYRKKKNRAQSLIRLRYLRHPALAEAMAHRHERYNEILEEIAQKESEGEFFVIAPPAPLAVGRIEKDPQALRLAWQMGWETAKQQYEALLQWAKS